MQNAIEKILAMDNGTIIDINSIAPHCTVEEINQVLASEGIRLIKIEFLPGDKGHYVVKKK